MTDGQQMAEDHPSDATEDIQLSLDPKVQIYLAHVSQESGCWGRCVPIPFERAARRSWWDPTFDSEILEEQYKKSAEPYNRFKFRYALWYLLLISLAWLLYFLVNGLVGYTERWEVFVLVLSLVTVFVTITLVLTYTNLFVGRLVFVSFSVILVVCVLSLSFVVLIPLGRISYLSPAAHFSVCVEILLIIYTLIPLQLYVCITLGVLYSVVFEIMTFLMHEVSNNFVTVFVKLLSHVCIHLIGLHILVMTNVRMRNTFMKVGQSLLVRQQLESEKKLKENMIHSLMPPSVAQWLLNEDENFTRNGMEPRVSDPDTDDIQIQSLFRPFNMNRVENVSILFADIVGFTKMSSNKSAEEVVEILNNLFQRFDLLCKLHNCEKISTLGDCYYCVSGCPEPRPDHAKCCVEMGLSMIHAIRSFDQEQNEGVNMRVGVHTGTVLCGIVGTKRFKFDVWSNDVTLANRMESTGKPGMVHISEQASKFLDDLYLLEEGEPVFGLKTYFILGRRNDRLTSYNGSFKLSDHLRNSTLKVTVSPPTSPPSVSPQRRPRVLSYDTSAYMKPHHSPNHLSPDMCKIKASSLPSILDSEGEQEHESVKISCEAECVKTPTSTASSGRYSVKLKSWKIPKFLRKTEQKVEIEVTGDVDAVTSPSGYSQVPAIIETQTGPSFVPDQRNSWSSIINDEIQDTFYLEEPKDNIDVKSYISQSRSDISPYDYSPNEFNNFLRSGSYRSQRGRSPSDFAYLARAGSNRSRRGRSPNLDLVPTERARSATVHSAGIVEEWNKNALQVPRFSAVTMPEDHVTMIQSGNSRKDSGIKSNSRRSSIQQIENPSSFKEKNNQQHRVSGYYTSSQSTINSTPYPVRLPGPFFDKFGTCIQNLRKQSDRQLIKCVQENCKSKRSYFMKPPLSRVTLFFKDAKMEHDYRANVRLLMRQTEDIPTLANSRFNLYLDVFISAAIYAVISACLFILYEPTVLWVCVFCASVVLQLFAFGFCFYKLAHIFKYCQRWYRWNVFGAVFVSLPLLAVLVNFSCERIFSTSQMSDYLYSYLLFIGVVHFCNFTQMNCWMKNTVATCFGITFIFLVFSDKCPCIYTFSSLPLNVTQTDQRTTNCLYNSEIFLDLLLLLFLVWFLNREFEIGFRLSFHSNFVATRDKIDVQRLKNQADWLIYNIVPEHVAEQLKKNAKYSENFKNVGIIFASIVNFNEMYDESYSGGKEFLRVLNELIGDFDELLTLPEFQSVEKIKTIGSTFMAASGLNSRLRLEHNDPNRHLFELMDFAIAMQNVIENFNSNLLEFNLILRIGYNFGDVTAAVIGKTKLYYDIWGDAVNIASRMDTTGVNGRIQVGEHCLGLLEERYVFEPRGSVYVKGKDNMNVFLLLRKKDE